ncbi:MAG: MlaD family protein [Candidatus Cloacimonadales bacterium]
MKFYPNKHEIEFKVGLFALVAAVALIAGYMWLTNAMDLQKYQTVKISFEQADGLEKGTGVYIRGINCGKVSSVKLRPDDVLITILLKSEIKLPADSRFIISDSGLVGSKIIKVVLSQNPQMLDLEKIQSGENSAKIGDLVQQAGNILASLSQLFSQDGAFISDLENLVAEGNSAFGQMDDLLQNNSEALTATMQNMQQATADLEEIIAENKAEFSDSKELLIAVQNTIQQIDSSFVKVDEILATVQDHPGSINKMLNEDELYDNLLKTSQNLDSLLVDIKKNPRRYFKLF